MKNILSGTDTIAVSVRHWYYFRCGVFRFFGCRVSGLRQALPGRNRLERLPDPEALENAGLRFLDLSLDGKAMLCLQIGETMAEGTSGYHLSLILGKEILPVTVNAGTEMGICTGKRK